MTRCRSLIALTVVVAFCPRVASAEDASLQKFVESWADAWQVGDVDKMMALYDSAKGTTAIESRGAVHRGPSEIRKMYQGAFDELIFDRVTMTPITQNRQDSVAWGTFRYKAQVRLRADDAKFVIEVKGTLVMKRVENEWKITLEDFSTIPGTPRAKRRDE